jgi:hypothetical protein
LPSDTTLAPQSTLAFVGAEASKAGITTGMDDALSEVSAVTSPLLIVDTGVLVAAADRTHYGACSQLLTSEPQPLVKTAMVIAEAAYLLRSPEFAPAAVFPGGTFAAYPGSPRESRRRRRRRDVRCPWCPVGTATSVVAGVDQPPPSGELRTKTLPCPLGNLAAYTMCTPVASAATAERLSKRER